RYSHLASSTDRERRQQPRAPRQLTARHGCSSLPYCNAPNSGTLRIVNTSLTTTAHHGAPASLPRDAPPSTGLRRASSRLTHLLQLRPRLPCVPALLKLRFSFFQSRYLIRARHRRV